MKSFLSKSTLLKTGSAKNSFSKSSRTKNRIHNNFAHNHLSQLNLNLYIIIRDVLGAPLPVARRAMSVIRFTPKRKN